MTFGFPASLCCTHTTRLFSNLSFWLSEAVLHCVVLPVQANIFYLRFHYTEIHSRIKHASRKCKNPILPKADCRSLQNAVWGTIFFPFSSGKWRDAAPFLTIGSYWGYAPSVVKPGVNTVGIPIGHFTEEDVRISDICLCLDIYSLYGWDCLHSIYRNCFVLKCKNMRHQKLKSSL